jgi:hypothetical protein
MTVLENLHSRKMVSLNKKSIVRITNEERAICEATVKNEKGRSEKLRRSVILVEPDTEGPGWSEQKIIEAVGCCIRTVARARAAHVAG